MLYPAELRGHSIIPSTYVFAPKSLSLFCLILKEKGHPEVPLFSMRWFECQAAFRAAPVSPLRAADRARCRVMIGSSNSPFWMAWAAAS